MREAKELNILIYSV